MKFDAGSLEDIFSFFGAPRTMERNHYSFNFFVAEQEMF